jgi:hypothetical protein
MPRPLMTICAALLVSCGASTLHLRSAAAAGCEDFVPDGCKRVTASLRLDEVVKNECYVFDENSTGANRYENLNVLAGGKIYFVDPGIDPNTQQARTIDFKVSAMLIEKGGVVQAGSPTCPFGKEGGKLAIGLYGQDPTDQGATKPPADKEGIRCKTNPDAVPSERCFPSSEYTRRPHYCTVKDSDDPCSSTDAPDVEPKNHLLQAYGKLNFDYNPWGYKVIGVAYGGTLALYGYKGSKPLQDPSWGRQNDPADHCPVPNVNSLDVAEMQAWADLSGHSWARLAGSVDDAGMTKLTLDRNVLASPGVADWKVGDDIVIGATDWHPDHSELRTIRKITPLPAGTQIEVDVLKFPHSSKMFDAGQQRDFTTPVSRTAVDTRAVVGLLSRSIQVYSLGKTATEEFPKTLACTADKNPDPNCYFGGHLIVRQGFKQLAIQGVEFKWLGQGGRIGHYPVHFHMAKATDYTNGDEVKGTFVKDSSVWDSMTRFVTIHGTHDVTLARNVGYLSLGHGYYIEDASEIRNRLCHNLGVDARAALKEYVAEQQKMEHWCGGEPPPAARVVPPILDGSMDANNPASFGPNSPTGSDSYMPTMYWMMNAYNEFVGNAAVGVHGFGSCFWLLGSAVSGPSMNTDFDGFAKYNTTGYQAPLLRFRGNTCMTSPLALPSTREVKPGGSMPEARETGFTDIANPYLSVAEEQLNRNYMRPIINGNFRPLLNGQSMNCSTGADSVAILNNNAKSCVMTVLDRFATSYNWAQLNFASIWLRPWFYLFSNGAVTDQLFGGLGFVTGGDWQQALPAYLALAQNNLFVGTSQAQDAKNLYARRSGPRFVVSSTENLAAYSHCKARQSTCNLPAAGTGYWRGEFQPKRLLTIYDGPTYADGNAFMNVGAWECNAQPCSKATSPDKCEGFQNGEAVLPCGIYSSTTQPVGPKGGNNIVVVDAGIGWKQPNGFYYPPAFDYRRTAFLKDRTDDLNKCFTTAPGDLLKPAFLPGSCRHNVIDRTQVYQIGNMEALNAPSLAVQSGPLNQLDAGTIDFATILLDLDGTLTGSTSTIDGRPSPGLTTSVSRNHFYDAPSQSPECLSYGLQTSPYTFISTVMGELKSSPSTAKNAILRSGTGAKWARSPRIAIYRQWKLKADQEAEKTKPCTEVCDGGQYGCRRASFMGMANLSQPSYLTMTEPQGLDAAQTGALYYIDTNSGNQSLECVKGERGTGVGTFNPNQNYVLYNLFPQRDSKTRYQLYVGENVKELSEIEFRYVRVTVAETTTVDGDALQKVEEPCDPLQSGQWCSGLAPPKPENGVLTVTLDHKALLANDSVFTAAARPEYDRCMPRDLCYFDKNQNRCRRCDPRAPEGEPSKCLRSQDFLDADIRSMNALDQHDRRPLDDVCEEWSSMVSGEVKVNNGADVTAATCPAGGCLGFAFKLPAGFAPKPYATVNNLPGKRSLSRCFVESAWMKDELRQRNGDPQCGEARKQKSEDFCSDPETGIPVEKDDTIRSEEPSENSGDSQDLVVAGDPMSESSSIARIAQVDDGLGDVERSLVGFDHAAIDSFLAQRPLTAATLELTLKFPIREGVLVDVHPLLQDFTEGHWHGAPPVGTAVAQSDAPAAAGIQLQSAARLTPLRRGRRLPRIVPPPTVPGVTWECASDPNPNNGTSDDCTLFWDDPGGNYGPATAPLVSVQGLSGTVIRWDVTADVMADVSRWLVRLHDETSDDVVVFYSDASALAVGEPGAGPTLILE